MQSNFLKTKTIKKSIIALSAAITLGSLLSACTMPSNSNVHLADFGYTNVKGLNSKAKQNIGKIRLKALQDTATSLGAQGALAWRAKQINAMLDQQAPRLDQIFNFNQLVENHNLLPPVIIKSENNYQQSDSNTIRLNQVTYEILKPSRFITVPPTWRDYLTMNFTAPDKPDDSLLPQNNSEVKVWNNYLSTGWKQGVGQANQIYQENLNRLKRDINGMVLYRQLLEHKMISNPNVSKAELGVTGNSKKISIGDEIMRITKKSGLSTDSSKWRAVLTGKNK